mgnify:CR=1 FL=1
MKLVARYISGTAGGTGRHPTSDGCQASSQKYLLHFYGAAMRCTPYQCLSLQNGC